MGTGKLDAARYARAADLFLAVADLATEEQKAFLRRECANEQELLEIVEQLLSEDRDGSILPEPKAAASIHREPLSGLTLKQYRVLEPIGEGGMGTVYRATDTRLDRIVALKFQPPQVLQNITSRDRFWREAKIIASIDHPNVCPVYGIEEDGAFLFIAMAYLDGIPLDRMMAAGRVNIDQSLKIAIQACRGLEAAHSKGVVHRDIKPANLMITPAPSGDPLVRILDFGIAQSGSEPAGAHEELTMGTVCYMAPEQIDSGRVDARADIWSLGVVLYEMLSGRLPFEAASVRETLNAIAGPARADFTVLPPQVPSSLVRILERMLDKDVAMRYQTAQQLVADLEKVGTAMPARLSRRRTALRKTLRTLAVVLIAASVWAIWTRVRRPVRATLSLTPFTFYPGYEENPAISPDGSQIAYVGQGVQGTNPLELYVQSIGSTDPLRLTRNDSAEENKSPVWDPTGKTIAVLRGVKDTRLARILVIPAQGGPGSDLGVEGALAKGRLAWSPDGKTLAFTRLHGSKQGVIYELAIHDRTLRQVSFPGPGQTDCCPQFDSFGHRLAFKRNEVEIVVTDLRTGALRALPARASWPGLTWTADNKSLLFSWFGWMGEVNVSDASIRQPAQQLRYDIMDITVRGNVMACVRWEFEHSIWSLELLRSAHRAAAGRSTQLITSTSWDNTPQFSADGKWIAFSSGRSGNPEIWISGADGLNARRLTFLGYFAGSPRWSPDGKRIVFDARPPASKPSVYVVPVSGGQPARLTNAEGDLPSWSRDGQWIYYHARADDQIWKIPASGGTPVVVTRGGGFEAFESADGRSLIYSKIDGGLGIWRLDLSTGEERPIAALAEAGKFRHWALAPRGIYYVPNVAVGSPSASINFFDFATGNTSRVAQLGRLVELGPGMLAVSPDETSLLYVPAGRDSRDIMLVKDFH